MESLRSDSVSVPLPEGAGTILQVFRQSFASQSPTDELLVFYLRGRVAECIIRTEFQDAEFRTARGRIFREADAARPLIGYRESPRHVAGLLGPDLRNGYDRDLYQERRALVDTHRARLGKEPTLVGLVNGEFNLGLRTPGLAHMVSKRELATDFRNVCSRDLTGAAFKDKYKYFIGDHLKALATLAIQNS